MAAPLASVVMPVHNAVATVEAAVRSLLRQTYADLEIIVVDDGSTDDSAGVVERVGGQGVRVIRALHRGVVAARNTGCRLARGRYLACLDADDVAHERRLAAQVEYLTRHPDVGLLGTWAQFEDETGRTWRFEPPTADRALRRYLLRDNPFVHSSVMFRREAYEAAGGYPDGPDEDYRLWVRIARSWQLGILPEVLVTHRIRRGSYSRARGRRQALWNRLAVQWEAARTLGPWHAALPALAATIGVAAVAALGSCPDAVLRRAAVAGATRWRGVREVRGEDRRF
ncbi:MAG: glycosyltransferase family 2 protein [Armatimonadota bacterium]|nr:glycosyltransferase family 2 protein [Armatimonadota bacterium]